MDKVLDFNTSIVYYNSMRRINEEEFKMPSTIKQILMGAVVWALTLLTIIAFVYNSVAGTIVGVTAILVNYRVYQKIYYPR